MSGPRARYRARRRAAVALLIVVPAAFAMKYAPGPGAWWLNNWGASIGYELFFMLGWFFVFPRRRAAGPIVLGVTAATCGLEFLQLWQPSWLQAVRATYLGAAVLGTSFSWADLPAYPIGGGVGWILLGWLARR